MGNSLTEKRKPSQSFEDLLVWQKAHEFVLKVYTESKGFPDDEKYGLTSQFRRAAVSIAANIAEGYRKKGFKDKLRFYNIAQGSLSECKYFCILSKDLEYTKTNNLGIKAEEVSVLLNNYCHAMERNSK